MKIVTVNRNYYITGGPEKYLFSLQEGLKDWQFIPFAVDFPNNLETPYKSYFVSPPSDQGANRFDERGLSFWRKMTYAARTIYSIEARKKLMRLIDDTNPQAAFFLNAVYFSQSIIDACRKKKLPIIWRLSDYNLICGNYLLYRDGHICTECIDHGLKRILANRCGGYQRTYLAAIVRYLAMQLAMNRDIYRYVDYFVCPSTFTREIILKAGFPREKVVHIPTFVQPRPESESDVGAQKNQMLFVGRISPEKGLDVLVKALTIRGQDNWNLIVAGGANSDYAEDVIKAIPASIREKIHFDGFITQDQVFARIQESRFVLVSSVCFENMPNVVLEVMAAGRPVIASHLGSLSEMVKHGETGLLFEAGNADDLAKKIEFFLKNPRSAYEMGVRAREHVVTHHSPERHFKALEELFHGVAFRN